MRKPSPGRHSLVQKALCLVLALALTLSFATDAAAKNKTKTKKRGGKARIAHVMPIDRDTAAYADLVVDARTGRIIHATNMDAIRHPASLTKMMTLYLTFQAIENGTIRLETPLSVSANAAAQSPSKLGLRAGQTIRAYDAIMGLVTESANDAAVVLAENLGGTTAQFAEMMTGQARALGMSRTNFVNPSGLPDDEQVTTARDMVTLGLALITHYPGFYPYFSHESFSYAGHVHRNHNHLMSRYDGMDGIKTGYIRASGFNLVASAVQNDTRLVAAVFGGRSAPSRDNQMANLLDESFASIKEGLVQEDGVVGKRIALPSKTSMTFAGRRRQTLLQENSTPSSPDQDDALKEGTTSSGAWGIQIGAYSDIEVAQQFLATTATNLQPLLGQAEPSVQKVTIADGSAMYRARFVGLDQKSARAACSHLIRRGQGCLVVSGP